MYKQSHVYASFFQGELSPELFGRGNFAEYRGGAMLLRNMHALSGGGVTRRAGTIYCSELPARGKLISFEYSPNDRFVLAIMPGTIHIYSEDGRKLSEVASPYQEGHLTKIQWAQKGSDLYMVHPDVAPRILSYNSITNQFHIRQWPWRMMPTAYFTRDPQITLTPWSMHGGFLDASAPVFTPQMIGQILRVNGTPIRIANVISPIEASGLVTVREFPNTLPDPYWEEPAFSDSHGWPSTITFHQNRLVIGGSRSLPNRLWFSKTGDYMNFDFGNGLDTDAIEFDMLSDKMNQISCVFSGRHLQVFTSDSEWMVEGSPLTPTSVALRPQTQVGSDVNLSITPKLVEGSTVFVSRGGKELREFVYGETEGGYFSLNLAALSSHLLRTPVELEYDSLRRTICITNSDGTLAALTMNKAMAISSWSLYETDGQFISLTSTSSGLLAIVKRGDRFFLESFRNDINTDCALKLSLPEPTDIVSGLSHLEGKNLAINADGYISYKEVVNGQIKLEKKARNIEAGIPFKHILAPMPIFSGRSRPPKAAKILELVARVQDTALLEIDTGGKPQLLSGRRFNGNNLFDIPLELYTGDLWIRSMGFIRDFQTPLFKVEGQKPLQVNILNISATIQIIR